MLVKYKGLYVSLNLKVKLYVDFSDTAHRKKIIVFYVIYIYIYICIYTHISLRFTYFVLVFPVPVF